MTEGRLSPLGQAVVIRAQTLDHHPDGCPCNGCFWYAEFRRTWGRAATIKLVAEWLIAEARWYAEHPWIIVELDDPADPDAYNRSLAIRKDFPWGGVDHAAG